VLPVLETRPGWLEVRLAQRPNGTTAWVLATDVTLATSPYVVVIDLATTHLTLLPVHLIAFPDRQNCAFVTPQRGPRESNTRELSPAKRPRHTPKRQITAKAFRDCFFAAVTPVLMRPDSSPP
jgi:hypothetical protein